jgi:hypothetical protein
MLNLTPTQHAALMPSPMEYSTPQNPMEQHLQQMLLEGLQSGVPVEYASTEEFARSMHERGAARAVAKKQIAP